MSHGDPYVYPGTNVLKNLFNERDKSKLDTREQILTSIALDDLRKKPVKGKFDGAHLKEIHNASSKRFIRLRAGTAP
jgi:cell filamentation protein